MVSLPSNQWPYNYQYKHANSQSCQFTFLESYQEGSGSEEPNSNSMDLGSLTQSPLVSEDTPVQSVEDQQGFSDPALQVPATQSLHTSEISVDSSSIVNLDTGPSVPKRIQVVRRRKPYDYEEDYSPPFHTGHQALPTTLPNRHQAGASDILQAPYLRNICYVLYTFVLFRLPDHYRRNALSVLGCDHVTSSRVSAWETFHCNFKNDITYFGTAASIVFGWVFLSEFSEAPLLIIMKCSLHHLTNIKCCKWSHSSNSHAAIHCLSIFWSYLLIYIMGGIWEIFWRWRNYLDACELWMWYLKLIWSELCQSGGSCAMEYLLEPVDYAVYAPGMDTLVRDYDVSVIWSLITIYRGFIYFAFFLVAFLWRSGATNEPDEQSRLSPNQAYGPRVMTTLIIVIGVAYFGLIIHTINRFSIKYWWLELMYLMQITGASTAFSSVKTSSA